MTGSSVIRILCCRWIPPSCVGKCVVNKYSHIDVNFMSNKAVIAAVVAAIVVIAAIAGCIIAFNNNGSDCTVT